MGNILHNSEENFDAKFVEIKSALQNLTQLMVNKESTLKTNLRKIHFKPKMKKEQIAF